MKHPRKALSILLLFVTPLVLSGIITTIPEGDVVTLISQSPTRVSVLSYEDHALLNIVGDDAFHYRAENESWDGDGSELTPYIIEGYNFSLDTVCITLTNISVYFEIRDCFFSSATVPSLSDGLQFVNVTHASIVDSIFENKSTSIWMIDSHNAIIDNCTIRDGTSSGVYIGDSNAVLVNECDISSNSHNISMII
jgi:parallel beta-helix repeat protein